MGKVTIAFAMLLGSGCVTSYTDWHGGERQAAIDLMRDAKGSGMPPQSSLSPDRARYRAVSEDWTAGRLKSFGDGYVVVDSAIPGVGSIRLALPPDAVAFDGNERVSIRQLPAGADVRANFVGRTATTPRLVSIEVLTPDQLPDVARK